MSALRESALLLAAFAAFAGIAEALLPDGRLRRCALGLLGLLAARLIIGCALAIFWG